MAKKNDAWAELGEIKKSLAEIEERIAELDTKAQAIRNILALPLPSKAGLALKEIRPDLIEGSSMLLISLLHTSIDRPASELSSKLKVQRLMEEYEMPLAKIDEILNNLGEITQRADALLEKLQTFRRDATQANKKIYDFVVAECEKATQ